MSDPTVPAEQDGPPAAQLKPLTKRERRFVAEYLIDLNATQAVRRMGFKGTAPKIRGWKLKNRPHVLAAINEAIADRAKRTEIMADMVLEQLWLRTKADPNELVENRRVCCRHCWGIDHRYQSTPAEHESHRAGHDQATIDAAAKGKTPPVFDELGGIGFDKRRPPHPECPECNGEGHSVRFTHDTRKLSRAGRALFAGVKETKEGVEIKTNSQDKALELIGRHLGMWKDRLEHTGANGAPLAPPVFNFGFKNGGPGEPDPSSEGS